ncbi:N-acetylmuramoyl-L-alanine amidase [Nocardioides sp. R1-1]|uniref:N-acetylmuramoyl-L-alanine amidase family protein n=1 Tax=Nocardioides sp. R1-1 TaxID=3383502 RepID=UPI0038CFBF8A
MVRTGLVLASVAVTLAGCSSGEVADGPGDGSAGPRPPAASADPSPTASATVPRRPLAGRVVVLDPGHQLGNARFRSRVDRAVDAGGLVKACNTTGTASDDGYPEATFAWEVAVEVRRLLRRAGARVLMTREDNSHEHWGPCIDERGRIGNPGQPGPAADVRLSIHGDGALSPSAHGFHVIRPGRHEGWTDDIVGPSERLALAVRDALVRAGFAPSTYRGEDGIDVRSDLGTLNHSDIPAVMAELGNMRAPADAAAMTSVAGRQRYARALAAAVRTFLR